MKQYWQVILFFVLILTVSGNAYATHLMGGNIQYEYLGKNNATGKYEYYIKMFVYQDCNSPYWGNGFPVTSTELDVYEGPADFSSTLDFKTTFTLNLTSSNPVELDLPAGCSVNQTACIYETIYEGTIALDISFEGYHLFYDDCCRNNSIINLNNPGGQGMVYSAFIPPPLVENNSPIFQDVPLPFLCVNDTTTILNTAYDPDGDLLVFSIVDPYEAYTSVSLGGGTPATLDSIYTVVFAPGYNYQQPFGNNGYTYINAFTGYSQYMSPTIGNFVIAVEIKEYRDGNLIGISRRDIQLLITDCPNTNTYNPEISSAAQTVYNIEEGEQLCFDVVFNDNNGDSIFLSTNSSLFDPSIVNPPATINTPVSGLGTATANFCWNTACGQGRAQPYTFDIKAIDNGCAPKNGDMTFQINVAPFTGPSTISGPDIVCSGASGITYTTDFINGATYNWSINGGNIVSGNGSNSVTVNWGTGSVGELFVTATSQYGCNAPVINKLVSISIIPVSVSSDTTICEGDSVQLSVSPPGYTYVWSPASSIDNINISNPTVWPGQTTTYIVTVSDNNGCFAYDSVTVNVLSTEIIVNNDTAICFGDSLQLEAVGGANYTWSPASVLDDATISNPWAYPVSNTMFYVTVVGVSGCSSIDSVFVSVNPVPFADAGQDTTVCSGQSVVLGGNPTGPATANYLWTPSAVLDNAALPNPTANVTVTTQFIVSVYENGCASTDTVNVFPSLSLSITVTPPNVTICEGDTVQVNVNASSVATYSWFPNSGISDVNISNPRLYPMSNTIYYVTATTSAGCEAKDSVQVTVNPKPLANAGNDVWICPGGTRQFNASGGDFYNWSPSTGLSSVSISNPAVSVSVTTQYIVTVSNIYGCADVDTVIAIAGTNVPTEAGNDTTVCLGDTVMIGGDPTAPPGTVFSWSPAADISNITVSNPFVYPSVTTKYYVYTSNDTCTGVDSVVVNIWSLPNADAGSDQSICLGDSLQLTASGGVDYLWSPSNLLSDNTISNPWAYPTVTQDFIVTVTDVNGCRNSDTIQVTVNNLPVASITAPMEICYGDTAEVVGSGGVSYLWDAANQIYASPNNDTLLLKPTTSQYVYLTVTDINGCKDSTLSYITVHSLPVAEAGNDTILCIGDTIMLQASGGITYSWSPNISISDVSIFNPNVYPSSSMYYYVTVTDANGCSNNDSVYIDVKSLPMVTVSNDTSICPNDSVQIWASGGADYLWSPSNLLSDNTISNPWAYPSDSTAFVVTVTDVFGCENSDTVIVTIYALPNADAGADVDICLGTTVTLTATGGIYYEWNDAATLSNITISNPVASPTDTIMYIVTVTDINGCANSDTVMVNVLNLPDVQTDEEVWLCPTDSIMLTATGATLYTWTPLDSIINENTANPTVFPSDTTDYIVMGTDMNGCVNYDTVTVIVNPVVPTEAGDNKTICYGDSVQIGGAPTAPPGTVFNWTPALGLDNISIANPMASPPDTTLYFVETLNHVCNGRDSVYVYVNPLPVAEAGANTEICIGDTLQLMASGGITYQWSPNVNITLLDSNVTEVYPTDTIIYYLTVTDANGCSNTDSVQVTVNPLPDVYAGQDVAICFGDTVQLQASGADSYYWSPNLNINNVSISNPNVYPTASQEYNVLGTDSNGCKNIDTVLVTVHALPQITVSDDTAICKGDTIEIWATGANQYLWQPNVAISNVTISNPAVYPSNTSTYYVTITDSNNCSASDSVEVVVYMLPDIDAGSDVQICIGDSVQIQASGGVSYQWYPNIAISDTLSDAPVVYPSDTTTYFVIGTDTNTCANRDSITVVVNPIPFANAGGFINTCEGDTLILGGSPTAPVGATVNWTPLTGFLSSPNDYNPLAIIDSTIEYVVQVTDTNGCVNKDTVRIETFEIARINGFQMCANETGQLSVEIISGASPYAYHWQPFEGLDDTTSGTVNITLTENQVYSVTVTDANNCKKIVSDIEVEVEEAPVPKYNRAYTPLCEGLLFELRNQSEKTDYFYWRMPDNTLYERELLLTEIPYNSNAEVYLVAENIYGCKDSLKIPFLVDNFEDYVTLKQRNIFTPNGDGVNDFFEINDGEMLGECSVLKVYNRWGTLIFETTGNNASWDGTTYSGQKVPEGVYYYIVQIRNYTFKGSVTLIR